MPFLTASKPRKLVYNSRCFLASDAPLCRYLIVRVQDKNPALNPASKLLAISAYYNLHGSIVIRKPQILPCFDPKLQFIEFRYMSTIYQYDKCMLLNPKKDEKRTAPWLKTVLVKTEAECLGNSARTPSSLHRSKA